MKDNTEKILWEIDFNQKDGAAKVEFILHDQKPESASPAEIDPTYAEETLISLEYLDKLNHFFQSTALMYLDKIEKTPENEAKIKEINQKFEDLTQWIAKIRKLFDERKDLPPSKENQQTEE